MNAQPCGSPGCNPPQFCDGCEGEGADTWDAATRARTARRARLTAAVQAILGRLGNTCRFRASWPGWLTVTRSTYPGVYLQVTRWDEDMTPEGHAECSSVARAVDELMAHGSDAPDA